MAQVKHFIMLYMYLESTALRYGTCVCHLHMNAFRCGGVTRICCEAVRGRGQPGNVPRLERAVPRRTQWDKVNRVNSETKLLKSLENNFDVDIFIKESIDIADISVS